MKASIQPEDDLGRGSRPERRVVQPDELSGHVSPSRSWTVPATMAMTISDMSAPAADDGEQLDRLGLVGQVRPTASRRVARRTTPPTTAENVRAAWLASVPYQGTSRSSRRSMVETIATSAPAAGPPSAIAAMMNGRWKVRTPWPCMLLDARPAEQADRDPEDESQEDALASAGVVSEIVSSIGNVMAGPDERRDPGDDRDGGVDREGRAARASLATSVGAPAVHASTDHGREIATTARGAEPVAQAGSPSRRRSRLARLGHESEPTQGASGAAGERGSADGRGDASRSALELVGPVRPGASDGQDLCPVERRVRWCGVSRGPAPRSRRRYSRPARMRMASIAGSQPAGATVCGSIRGHSQGSDDASRPGRTPVALSSSPRGTRTATDRELGAPRRSPVSVSMVLQTVPCGPLSTARRRVRTAPLQCATPAPRRRNST